MKIADSVVLSLFMTSTEMCSTGQAPLHRRKQNSIFIMTLNELSDFKGPENIICTMMVIRGDFLRPPLGTSPAAVETNKF